MDIIVKTWTKEGQFRSELITENIDEAMAHVEAEVRLGGEVRIETELNGDDDCSTL